MNHEAPEPEQTPAPQQWVKPTLETVLLSDAMSAPHNGNVQFSDSNTFYT